jgi:anti-sigma regulatory factor (Ser/Thr protein kinase)
MPESSSDAQERRLTIPSRLEGLSLVQPWVEGLAAEYAISDNTQFAINLCLEEALSNVIRHGYLGEPGHSVSVVFTAERDGGIAFIVEDHAPPFNPLESVPAREAATPASLEELQPSGRGISFIRKFSRSLSYERLPDGNRLTIGFAPVDAKTAQ